MNPGWNHVIIPVIIHVQSIVYLWNTLRKLVNHAVKNIERPAISTIDQERVVNHTVNHVVIVAWNTLSTSDVFCDKSPNLHQCCYVKCIVVHHGSQRVHVVKFGKSLIIVLTGQYVVQLRLRCTDIPVTNGERLICYYIWSICWNILKLFPPE